MRLVVEGVKDDAVGKAVGRFVAGCEGPDCLGGQRALAHAARAAERDHLARLEVRQQLGEFGSRPVKCCIRNGFCKGSGGGPDCDT